MKPKIRNFDYWKPQPLQLLEKYYKQSIKRVGKATIVDRAVLAYFDDGGDNDTNFKPFNNESEHAENLKKWMDKVSKYFDSSKTVRMPFGFAFYLLKSLEMEDRKACEAELYAWRSKPREVDEVSLLRSISAVNSESAEAVKHALILAENSSEETKLRVRKEIDDAIHSLEMLKKTIFVSP